MKRVTTTEKFDEYGRVTERTTVTEDDAYPSLSPGQMYPIPHYPNGQSVQPVPDIIAPVITWTTTSGSTISEVKNA